MVPKSTKVVTVGSAVVGLLAARAVYSSGAESLFCFSTSSRSPSQKTHILATSMTIGIAKQEQGQEKVWNRFANTYSKSPIGDMVSYEKKLELTRAHFTPTSRVLEFGCGTGGTALLHAPYVKHVDAIDVSSRMIEIAQEKKESWEEGAVDNVHFACRGLDSYQAQADDQSYDVVMGMSILHLMDDPEASIAKVNRLLKPGGTFVSSTMCMGGSLITYVAPFFSALGLIPKLTGFTKEELRSMIEANGFQVEEEFHPPGKNKAVFLVAKKKEE